MQRYQERFVYILASLIFVAIVFQLHLAIGLSFQCNIFEGSFE